MKIAFTICSANYLPYAKAVGDSLVEYNPDYQFIIALADTFNGYDATFFAPHKIISVSQMQISSLEEMSARYTIFELSCALKPYVADYLLHNEAGCEVLFYVDSDILFFGSLSAAQEALRNHFLLLTPHETKEVAYELSIGTELNVLRLGLYNAGFFGLANNRPETAAFLQWWKQRLFHHCYDNTDANGLFVDQLWLNLVPLYFSNTCIWKHAGYNVGYWNLQERELSVQENTYVINENQPLVFYHFSGYSINEPHILSKHQKIFSFENLPAHLPLFEAYRKAVLENNHPDFFHLRPGLGKPKIEKKRPFWKGSLRRFLGLKK